MTRKLVSLLAVVGLLIGMLATTAAPVAASQANPVDPVHLNINWGGCRGDVTNYIQQNETTPFICTDADYVNGQLGKGWNELDLVPERMTNTLGTQTTATTDYELRIDGDYINGAATGYDFITEPSVNHALSDASCSITSGPLQGKTAGSPTIYRIVSVHQNQGSTCVFDVDMRLAIGAHLFPGASLQSHIANADGQGGQKTNSIPVNQVLPQSISKDMTAVRNAAALWTVLKTPTPAVVNFGDTCDPGTALSAGVSIKVEWDKVSVTPSGDAMIHVFVYATNPAHRTITVNAVDKTYQGTGQALADLVDTRGTGDVDVPANTANFLILDASFSVTSSATTFNDVVTATYTDKLTGVPVPGTTTASDSATVQTGTTSNATATIADTESISGSGLTFSVPTPSVGTFTGTPAYVAGTHTTGPVAWSSGSQTNDGSVTFSKTIYVTSATSTSGTLTDTATLTGSDGFTTDSTANVTISSNRTSTLTITKTIPNVLQGAETQTFTFAVKAGAVTVATPSVTFTAGQTSKDVTVPNLVFGTTYTVSEDVATGWTAQDPQTVNTIGCTGSVTFNNTFGPASAQVSKVTVPAGNEAGWEMTLTGPGTPVGGEKVTTVGAGAIAFTTALQEGSYSISETAKAGWAQTSASADCSFTVNYPANNGHLYSCTFTNIRPDARIVLSPLTATNAVNSPHTITATVSQNDQLASGATGGDGTTGFGPAPNGTTVTFSLVNNSAGASFVNNVNTCTTTGGTCSVQINTTTPGGVDIHATTTFSVLTVSLTRASGDGLSGDSVDAHKTYVDAGIAVTPLTAVNSVRASHTITATVSQDDGLTAAQGGDGVTGFAPAPNGTIVNFSLPVNTANAVFVPAAPAGATCTISNGLGTCQVVITTTTAGNVDIHATSTFSVGGVSLTRATSTGGNNGADGNKKFVDANINISPLTATNPVNANHTITATVMQNDGIDAPGGDNWTGFKAAPDGTVVTFSLTNNAGATAVFVPAAPAGATCTISNGLGTCQVVINSPTAGNVDIHATTTFSVLGESLTRATGDGLAGDGANANKVYVSATLIIRKVTVPAGGTGFGFTTTGSGLSAFSLDHGGHQTFSGLTPGGPYTVTETGMSGWDLTKLECTATTGSSYSADLATGVVSATLAGNGVVDCTYTNTQRGVIKVQKQTSPAGGTGFTFTGDVAGTIDDHGTLTSLPLVPGTYSTVESTKTGWDLTQIVCNDGSSAHASGGTVGTRTATFRLDPGETVTCRFVNVQRGTIITKKVTSPAGGTAFVFTGTNAGTINDGQTITTPNLVPGTYTSTESGKTGWDLTGLSCDDGASTTKSTTSGSTATFKLDPGETVTCTFTNTQRANVRVTKTFKGGPIPAGQSFTFQIRTGASAGVDGTVVTPPGNVVVTSATVQPFALGSNLVPGSYQVCELIPGPGWNMSIANDLTMFVPSDPLAADQYICVPITLAAGQTLSLSFDNSPPPGGVGLTIGYWKNHSSCKDSKGKQQPVLDNTLALFPIDPGDLSRSDRPAQAKPGFYVGDEYVDTCLEAFRLLDKSTFVGNTKQASDPAFNFGSQFTAYKLNLAAGAADIAAANAAAAEGQAILDAHSFNGSTHTPFTAAEAAKLNADAGTLDKFNNNTL